MTITTLSTDAPPELVARINAAHNACVESYRDALEHAIDCGELLYQVRRRLAPGTWGRWVTDNFAGDERTARGYMQVAHAHVQDPQGLRANAGGSVQAAVAYLSRQVGGVTHTTFAGVDPADDDPGPDFAATSPPGPVVDAEVVYPLTRAELAEFALWCVGDRIEFDAPKAVDDWIERAGVEAAG